MGAMVAKNLAVFEPAKQTRSVLLYWRLPEEWAETLHEWVRANRYFGLKCDWTDAGGLDWTPEYDHDLLRSHGSPHRIAALWDSGRAAP